MAITQVVNPMLEEGFQYLASPSFTTYATVVAAKAGSPTALEPPVCYIVEKEAFYNFCSDCPNLTDDDLVLTTGAGGNSRWEMVQKVSRYFGDTGMVNWDTATLSVFSSTVLRLNFSTIATVAIKSVRYDLAVGNHDITISGASGLRFVYFDDDSGTLKSRVDLWDFNTQAPVAIVYWSGTAIVGAQTEFHGIRDTVWHYYAHQYFGAQYKSGMAFASATPVDSNANPPDATVQYLWSTTGFIQDEDALINVGVGNWLQTLGSGLTSTTAMIVPFYYWTGTYITTMAAMSDRTPFIHGGGNTTPQWENAGVLTASVTGDYIVYHYFASPQIAGSAIFARPHNAKFANLGAAQNARPASLTWTNVAEVKHLYSAVFRVNTTAFTNSPHRCKIASLQDFRTVAGGPVAASNPTSHAGLSGLSDPNVHPASSISTDTTNFNGEFAVTDTTMQAILDRLDAYDSILVWGTGKTYRVGNIVRITLEGFIGTWCCITAHTASAAVTTDINLGYWEVSANSEGSRELINVASHGFSAGDWLYHTGTVYAKAVNTSLAASKVVGVVAGATTDYFVLAKTGKVTKTAWGLTAGSQNYLSATVGASTTTRPRDGFVVLLGISPSTTTLQLNIDVNTSYEDNNPSTISTTLPTLDLDFSAALPASVTFARATVGSFFGYDGIMRYAASGESRREYDPISGAVKGLLLEEARIQLLASTEDFANSAWVATKSTISINQIVAPDGTRSANKLIEDTQTGAHYVLANNVASSASTTYTFSCFMKAGERTYGGIYLLEGGATVGYGIPVDLSAGTIGTPETTGAPTATASSITAVGNGWYKVAVTANVGAFTTLDCRIIISNAFNFGSYAGDGKAGIYIWGAQLEAGEFSTSYIPSVQTFTSRNDGGVAKATYYNSTGVLATVADGVSRTTYNPSPDKLHLAPKLLLEPAATNSCLRSAALNVYWNITRATTAASTTATPDGDTSSKYIALINNGSVSTSYAYQAYTTTANVAYTISSFIKIPTSGTPFDGVCYLTDFTEAGSLQYNFNTKAMVKSGICISSAAQELTNGWVRISATFLPTTSSSHNVSPYMFASSAGAGEIMWCWGAQVEAGYGTTSYIATTTVAVTRNADVYSSAGYTRNADNLSMTGTNFTSWYRFDEGTFYAESRTASVGASGNIAFQASNGSGNNKIQKYFLSTNDYLIITTNSASQASIATAVTAANSNKIVGAYKYNDTASTANSSSVTVDTSALIPNTDRLFIGSGYDGASVLNGHIRRLIFWPIRLSNAKLQQLTPS